MQNVMRGVGLSGLATLILVCAMATQAAAGQVVKVPTVQVPINVRTTLTTGKTSSQPSNPQNPGKGVNPHKIVVTKQTGSNPTSLLKNAD